MIVVLQDGHGPGLKALVNEDQRKVEFKLKLLACKHASSTSAIQQMADIMRSFAIQNKQRKQQHPLTHLAVLD